MIEKLWRDVFTPSGNGDTPDPSAALVLSLPGALQQPLEARATGFLRTADVFQDLLVSARRSIKIFSPYVDPTFTALAQQASAPIQVVTTLRQARLRSSPVLERFATTRPLAVRYLHEKRARAQMFQLHAKMILSDRDAAYIGSANFTDTSLHYNFELGLCVRDRVIIDRLHAIFDYVFEFAARPTSQV